jgi:dTDP-4-amino-4,6-dideoxygalactose transaminase
LGDAGLVVTRDAALAARVRRLRVHGAQPKYFQRDIGGNFRLDELQAAFLRVKLGRLDQWTASRRAHAARYDRLLGELAAQSPELLTLPQRSSASIVNQYTVQLANRDAVKAALATAGIATEIYYPRPLHLQECYQTSGEHAASLPEAERLAARALSLPVDPTLPDVAIERVVHALIAAVRR